jgi:hypothetical protein
VIQGSDGDADGDNVDDGNDDDVAGGGRGNKNEKAIQSSQTIIATNHLV